MNGWTFFPFKIVCFIIKTIDHSYYLNKCIISSPFTVDCRTYFSAQYFLLFKRNSTNAHNVHNEGTNVHNRGCGENRL
jgi:hypothetical protein